MPLYLEKLRCDAAECAIIRDLATDLPKRTRTRVARGAASQHLTVRDLALAVAGLAFDGVDFVAWLHRLHHHGKARSIAFRAGMLFDLRRHFGPFRPPQLAASFISRAAKKRPQQGVGGLSWGRPFQPPATREQAANGQPNYCSSADRSELVRSTSVGSLF